MTWLTKKSDWQTVIKSLFFSDKSENPHARVTGVYKFLTFTPP